MQIDIPSDLAERLQRFKAAGGGCTEADVIRRALDSLDWQERGRQAIQVGIEDCRAGRVQDFDEFDREFREKHGIATDE